MLLVADVMKSAFYQIYIQNISDWMYGTVQLNGQSMA